MCKLLEPGVLYTEYERIKANTPVASLWSYETCRGSDRPSVLLTRDGNREYWLERSDPLLNTILPGTGVSLIVNFGDLWASGRSPVTAAHLPRACVIGPVIRMQILRAGQSVRAVGVGLQSALTITAFGVRHQTWLTNSCRSTISGLGTRSRSCTPSCRIWIPGGAS